MEQASEVVLPVVRKEANTVLLGRSALLSLLWVTFLWGFFENGVYSLGINATAFLFLFFFTTRDENRPVVSYGLPLLMVALSFSLYENPFFKMVCLPVLPLIFGFYLLEDGPKRWRPGAVVGRVLKGVLLPLTQVGRAIVAHEDLASRIPSIKAPMVASVVKGLTILLFLSLLVIIPLLSWADNAFADRVAWIQEFVADYLLALLPEGIVARSIVFVVLHVLIAATIFAWRRESADSEEPPTTMTDSVAAGIVLAGILIIYLVFLSVQAEHLFLTKLPSQFNEVVWYVKSGFWQLIVLSVVNIFIFTAYYQRTSVVVQKLLAGFTLASLLILLSAGHRMFLYVMSRGFSYEKFYASYTVLYCSILFAILLFALVRGHRTQALYVTINLFVWMFGIVSLLPVEQIVLRTNLALYASQGATSEINLLDMRMLSSDVYGLVIENEELLERKDEYWNYWVQRAETTLRDKEWYEMNLYALMQGGQQ